MTACFNWRCATTGSVVPIQRSRPGRARDRATALGGQLNVESPPGGGTLVVATLPL